jgi:hypothetical protein
MINNDDILTTDTTEIKQLTNRVKQGELDQGDAQCVLSANGRETIKRADMGLPYPFIHSSV